MRRLKASILLFLFLFSLTGNATVVHFCHGNLKDISFAGKAECKKECHKNKISDSNQKHKKKCCHKKKSRPEVRKKRNVQTGIIENSEDHKCCEFDALVDLNEEMVDLKSDRELISVILILFTDYNRFIPELDDPADFAEYNPPVLQRDIPVLLQSFLI